MTWLADHPVQPIRAALLVSRGVPSMNAAWRLLLGKGTHMKDVDALAQLVKARFGQVTIRRNYGWPEKPALCVLDCVLSLNRRYDQVVYPRVLAFSQCR